MTNFQPIVNFIRELYNQPTGHIPLHEPVFKGNEKKYLKECIDSTFVSSVGKFVDKFEVEMANYTGAKKAVACVNGTSALHLALKLVGVEPGHEVITQPVTFIATANAINYCGAQPVFLDVDMDTMGLSPESLKKFIETQTCFNSSTHQLINSSTHKRISACLPVHTFGHPARIDEIVEICREYNLPVVEDAAESLGSFYKGQHTGTFGKIGVLSFNGNKIITTGGGGMLLFHDEELAKKAKHLSTQAKIPHPWEFSHDEIGYNYRMPNINAALGLAQLEQLPAFLDSKRQIAKKYESFFSKLQQLNASTFQPLYLSTFQPLNLSTPQLLNNSTPQPLNITFFKEPPDSQSNYWLNCILFNRKEERDHFLKYTNECGVMTRPTWQLMNELTMFRFCQKDKLKNSKEFANRLVNIPSSSFKIC